MAERRMNTGFLKNDSEIGKSRIRKSQNSVFGFVRFLNSENDFIPIRSSHIRRFVYIAAEHSDTDVAEYSDIPRSGFRNCVPADSDKSILSIRTSPIPQFGHPSLAASEKPMYAGSEKYEKNPVRKSRAFLRKIRTMQLLECL